jgi:molecular chaperone DnaJ
MNPFRVFGLAQTATKAEIKTRYFELAKSYHPDSSSLPDAAEKFQKVQNAYRKLTDNREAYVTEHKRYNYGRYLLALLT